MDWIVNINLKKEKGEFSPHTVYRQVYFDIDDKKEVLKKVKEDFSEYFSEKVPQRTSKDEFFFVTVYKLNDYWKSFWLDDIPCIVCQKNPMTRLDFENSPAYGHHRNYCCSKECKEEYNLRIEADKEGYDTKVVGYIYKITHKPTSKVYIGKTVNFPLWRWWQHIKAQSGTKFHEFFKENSNMCDWTFEAIDVVKEGTHEDLLALESKYIEEYKSTDDRFGFNTRA